MQSTHKTWHVPRDPPPDFTASTLFQLCLALNSSSIQTSLKVWLDNYPSRRQNTKKLEYLHRLERELEPVEWLAQFVWQQAGKDGSFDFDEVYTMVGPSDEVVFSRHERANLRSKLDELLSRTLDANEIVDTLLPPGRQVNIPTVKLNRLSSTIILVRAFCFSFAKTRVHGLDLLDTFCLGHYNRHR